MNNVIEFPCKARVAANDANPWLSCEPLPEPAKIAPSEEPVYAKPCQVYDRLSGITYTGYAVPDKEKPASRAWLFLFAVAGWLFLFALV